ncbi:hypothetical protein GCM10010145_13290 [Streptomyces ruber]|uniref:Uncharacterized protein n=2 Tax=Streptomyces TaxID=1883 RepID=A0A918B8P7_9ACTN|nr:hypothetical protein GCM10010145_13290 [Streptomyces ruber]
MCHMTATSSDRFLWHPGLTVAIYRVNPRTLERTPVRTTILPPADAPALDRGFPPCACPRCARRTDRRGPDARPTAERMG